MSLKPKFEDVEELLKLITEQPLVGYVVLQDDSIKFINEATSKILGHPIQEIKKWSKIDFQKLIQQEKPFKNSASLKENVPFYSQRITTKYGKVKWIGLYIKSISYHKRPATLMILKDITERELKYQTLFEDTLNPILVVDEKGHYIDANNAALDFLECSKKELLEKKVWDWTPPEFLEKQKKEHFPFVDHRTVDTEYFVKGKIKTLVLTVVPIAISGKTILYGIGQDITERKKMIEKLTESEENFRAITEQSLMGIAIIQDGKVLYANKMIEELTGYDKREILDWTTGDFFKIIFHEDLQAVLSRINQRESGKLKEIADYQYRLIHKSGKIVWIQGYSKTITYKGKLAILAGFFDITSKKIAEQKLLESQDRNQFLINNINDVILELSLDGKVKYATPQVKEMFGFEPEELIGKDVIEFVHPEDSSLIMNKINETIQMGKKNIFVKFRTRHKLGNYLTVSARGGLRTGEPPTIIGVLRDITKSEE